MKASEAKKISNSYTVNMTPIYEVIRREASKGETTARITSFKSEDKERIIGLLRQDGYKATNSSGYDERQGRGWESIVVSW